MCHVNIVGNNYDNGILLYLYPIVIKLVLS